MSSAVEHLQSIGINDEWETPPELYTKGLTLAGFTPEVDVCATFNNKKCLTYVDKSTNFLDLEISYDFFMNPPYSRKGWHRIRNKDKKLIAEWYEPYGIDDFIAHAAELVDRYRINALILTYAKTDTRWFNRYVYNQKQKNWLAEFHPIDHRVKFLLNGVPRTTAPYPSCWIIMRGHERR